MKKYAFYLCALLVPGICLAGGIEIKVNRKNQGSQRVSGSGEGSRATGSETIAYQVSVQNKEFKPMAPLKAKYVIFVERQNLGEKIGNEIVERVKGEATVPEMAALKSEVFMTDAVKLGERQLSGSYVYLDGGRVKAKDNIIGIWIKVFDGETEIGEYVNPTTLKARHGWE